MVLNERVNHILATPCGEHGYAGRKTFWKNSCIAPTWLICVKGGYNDRIDAKCYGLGDKDDCEWIDRSEMWSIVAVNLV